MDIMSGHEIVLQELIESDGEDIVFTFLYP